MPDQEARELAVVTGASSGIGLELARQFAMNGFDVMAAAEDRRIFDAAAELGVLGRDVIPVSTDLATSEGVEELYGAIAATGRPVDALVLNAGVGVGGEFVDTPIEDDVNLIELNVVSPVRLAKLVIPDMVKRGRGRVLLTASVASTMPGPYYATYAASKAFVLSFAQAIRHELGDRGVSVTALMPGPTDTDFFRRADMEDTPVGRARKDDPAQVAADAFEAMMAGSDHVVAGSVKNKAQTIAAKVLPETATAAVHGRLTRPDHD
jgi:uncharacterized protein